jgi:hypothetical protein
MSGVEDRVYPRCREARGARDLRYGNLATATNVLEDKETAMSPQLTSPPFRILTDHPQRPWRPVDSEARRPRRTVARTFCAPVVRELPPRPAQRELGTW